MELQLSSYVAPQGATVTFDGLALLLHRTPATLKTARSRAPHTLPPAHLAAGTRQPVWFVDEVLAWLRAQPSAHASAPAAGKRRVGRPSKAEQIAAGRGSKS